MATQSKTRAKNFSDDEIMTLIDIVGENKAKIFGALSSTLTADDKNKVWEEVACQISERHGTTRTRDDISKKWYNVLTKYKPRIADKLASIKRTGGGPAEESLDELEAKIYSIKGKEAFEGIESGIDLIQEQLSTGIYNEQMVISPTPSQEGEKTFFKQPQVLRKRKHSSETETSDYEFVKQSLLNNKEEKLRLLQRIDSKLEQMVTIFGRVAEDQSKILSWMTQNQTTQYPLLAPHFPPTNFPPSSAFYPPQDEYHK